MPFPHTIEQATAKPSPGLSGERGHPIKVMIVGDSHIVRSGLRKILESQASICVLDEVSVKQARMEVISIHSPDLILIDLDSRGEDALGLISAFRDRFETLPILVMIELENHELAQKALTLGAAGIVLTVQPPGVLIAAIRELCQTIHHSSTSMNGTKERIPAARETTLAGLPNVSTTTAKVHSLTAREREIIRLIGHGMKNKAIANQLSISDITVRHHLTSIFCKLEVEDRQKLLILAYRYGLADLSVSTEPA